MTIPTLTPSANDESSVKVKFARALTGLLVVLLSVTVTSVRATSELIPITDTANETGGRGYLSISIHPDSHRWLITECMLDQWKRVCLPYLYDLRSARYQRYALPAGYSYMYARFSPSGNAILAERNPLPIEPTPEEARRVLQQTEFIRLDIDGGRFQVLPIPIGESTMPVMSPDESKIAYWSATQTSVAEGQPKQRTQELREFDLSTASDRLFAGPFHFRIGGNFEYRAHDRIAVQIVGTSKHESKRDPISVEDKHAPLLAIVELHRGAQVLPEPVVAETFMYVAAMYDGHQRLHMMTQEKSLALSLMKINALGEKYIWQSPRFPKGGPLAMAVPADGRYTAFIYRTESLIKSNQRNRLGYFCGCNGGWYSVRLPEASGAEIIEIR